MVPGLVFLWAKNFKNKPMDIGQEDWQPASVREFDRIKSNIQLTRNKTYAVIYRPGFGTAIAILLLVAAFILSGRHRLGAVVCVDSLVLLIPFLFTGLISLWTPQELAFRMRVFEPILSSEKAEGETSSSPRTSGSTRTRKGHQVPEDVRLMVEPRRKAGGFPRRPASGCRQQGPERERPLHVFGVPLQGQRRDLSGHQLPAFPGDEKEPGGDKEYGYVVVRQETSGTGYQTTEPTCTACSTW